ncbi:MAG: hypothetical protein GWN87_28250, partial [Desulfuromonadales bacterium]|nr:hypothetical protein [Desulfuromonadales bacterium]NIS43570.1 hypothetical protein [Desulfuromonadales bacterium]
NDTVSRFNEYVQSSFRNGIATVEKLHQSAVEIPINMATQVGLPRDKANLIKDTHRRILKDVYGTVCGANEEIGALVVQQVGELRKLAADLGASRAGAVSKTGRGKNRPPASKGPASGKTGAPPTQGG